MPASQSPDRIKKLHALRGNSKAMILDFDGLLADSEPFHYKAYNEVFERYGHTLDPDEYWIEWTCNGKGIAGEIERHQLKLNVEVTELRRQKFEVYSQFCKNGDIKLFPETRMLAERLEQSYKFAIASGSWAHDIRTILDNAGALELFPMIFGKESSTREKPHPDIFLKAAKEMHCKPDKCLVIEDAWKGLTAAKKAGMACIIIRNPLNQDIDFKEADLVVPSLSQLVEGL